MPNESQKIKIKNNWGAIENNPFEGNNKENRKMKRMKKVKKSEEEGHTEVVVS